jgi:putative membrane protein
MIGILFRWFLLTIAVWGATTLVPGVSYDDGQSLLVASLVLGILNTFVKPLLRVVTIPFIIVTLGFFLLLINAALLGFTSWLVPGFRVDGFWPAVGGSLVISLISVFLGYPRPSSRIVVNRPDAGFMDPRRPPPGKGPVIDV